MKRLKLYLDTSVWNFAFADDAPEKRDLTLEFFKNVKNNDFFELYTSGVVLREIEEAPAGKREELINLIGVHDPVVLEVAAEVEELAEKYVETGIVPPSKRADALHIAIATVAEVDALVSWKYKHLANPKVKGLVQSANLREGYTKELEMITPLEVIASGGS